MGEQLGSLLATEFNSPGAPSNASGSTATAPAGSMAQPDSNERLPWLIASAAPASSPMVAREVSPNRQRLLLGAPGVVSPNPQREDTGESMVSPSWPEARVPAAASSEPAFLNQQFTSFLRLVLPNRQREEIGEGMNPPSWPEARVPAAASAELASFDEQIQQQISTTGLVLPNRQRSDIGEGMSPPSLPEVAAAFRALAPPGSALD